jgi:phospho-N-acetylmuramoyl-pentapeptide-transferase
MSFARYCGLFAFSCALSIVSCVFLIPLLKKIHAGQNILSYVKEHKNKSGTPTMGGFAFILAAIVATLVFSKTVSRTLLVSLVVGAGYMFVGALDDFLKMKRKENLGLTPLQKIVFQILVAAFASAYAVRANLTNVYIPFFDVKIDIGWWFFPLSAFVFLATVNCVNLTDGLDGLAAGVGVPFFLFFGIITSGFENGLSILSIALAAALVGYLLFNSSPASVFMGDTGSLALGGFAACIGVFSGNALYIALVGIAFVLSGASVILQVAYFKFTKGKRVFKMTPIHHHFQQCGYSETKIAYAYFTVTLLAAVICLIFI